MRLIAGGFDASLLNRRFDLVICNPPYVPLPPGRKYGETALPDHLQAISGIELLTSVVQEAPDMLTPEGRLLLMTSSLSIDTALDSVPETCRAVRPLGESGYEVLFDVEAVLDREDWLSYLLQARNLVERDRVYYHSLHPIWITKRQPGAIDG